VQEFRQSGIRILLKQTVIYLLCDFPNDRIVHPPTKNGTISLDANVIFSAVLDDQFLLAEWMKLKMMDSEIVSQKVKEGTSIWLTEGIS
jgi:hypothetical protein